MNTIPDFSYFALPGFFNEMRRRPTISQSFILLNNEYGNWEKALSDENAFLYSWLHYKTSNIHDIYLPYTLSTHFLKYNEEHIRQLIKPAKKRIKTMLKNYEIEDLTEYMKNSNEWLNLIFTDKRSHFLATSIFAEKLNQKIEDFPLIIITDSIDTSNYIVLKPNIEDENITEYIKSIYWTIVQASKNYQKETTRNIGTLAQLINNFLKQSYHIKEYKNKIRDITIEKTDKRLTDVLITTSKAYQKKFFESILSFEEYMEESPKSKSMMKFADETYDKLKTKLLSNGFAKIREGRNHEIWKHPKLKKNTSLPRHKKISPFVAKSIFNDIRALSY